MKKTNHEWSKEAFLSKAQLYAQAMVENEGSSWQCGLWSAFTLEMLIRAAVANISPALIADNREWHNLLYGLGQSPNRSKFVAKTAAVSELIRRVEELYPEFSREHSNFCAAHIARRNSEIHTGNLPFENVGSSSWLPMFYTVCAVLSEGIGESLESIFGTKAGARAQEERDAFRDNAAKSVAGTIGAHKVVWEQKTEGEREICLRQAETTALRHYGHRVKCPACDCTALLQGNAAGEAKRSVDGEGIVERQVMKPEAYHCVACGLKISSYSKLLAAGLGDTYITTCHYDAMEYFEVDLDEHYRSMMEDDNNEY